MNSETSAFTLDTRLEDGMLNNEGKVVGTSEAGRVTTPVFVVPGETVTIHAKSYHSGYAYALYNKDMELVEVFPEKSGD